MKTATSQPVLSTKPSLPRSRGLGFGYKYFIEIGSFPSFSSGVACMNGERKETQ